ncbi:MAG: S8 family serine peptidase [Desulfobulbaceae bacterium]|nr:S8 family serine peptidase [Desulfobulbaceae bacterium]
MEFLKKSKISPSLYQQLEQGENQNSFFRVIVRIHRKHSESLQSANFMKSLGQVINKLRKDASPKQDAISEFIWKLKNQRAEESQKKYSNFSVKTNETGNIHKFWITNSIAATLSSAEIEELAANQDVMEIVENKVLNVPPITASSLDIIDPGDENIWNLSAVGMNDLDLDLNGKGLRIGHLDTGIDVLHPDFTNKLIDWAEFDNQGNKIESEPHDSHYLGHGTHTASIMIGNKTGIAPGASLLSALVLPGGSGTIEQVMAGMEWILDPDDNPDTDDGAQIVNMSWGMSANSSVLKEAIQNMTNAGVLPVCAIGNEGSYITYSPGNFPNAVGVGAVNENNDVPFFSGGGIIWWDNSVNMKPDITAPGVDIVGIGGQGEYQALSGTSFAAPHVTGAAAILLQRNTQLSPFLLAEFLFNTSLDLGETGQDIEYGRGVLNVASAVKFLERYSDRFESADLVVKQSNENHDLPFSLYKTYFSDGQSNFTKDEISNLYIYSDSDDSRRKTLGFADVNGDGYSDLIIKQNISLNSKEYQVSFIVHLSSDARGLSTSSTTWYSYTSTTADQYDFVGFGDVNGDHNADIVLSSLEQTHSGQKIHITPLLSNGISAFESASSEWQTIFSDHYHSVTMHLGDANGDNKTDLVFAKFFNDAFATYPVDYFVSLSNGSIFKMACPWITIYSNYINGRPEFLSISDVTGDGSADLILSGYSSYWQTDKKEIYVCPSNSSSRFSEKEHWATIPWNPTKTLNSIEDVNGDGLKDLIINGTNEATNNWAVTVWLSNGRNELIEAEEPWLVLDQTSLASEPQIVGVANVGLGDWSDR